MNKLTLNLTDEQVSLLKMALVKLQVSNKAYDNDLFMDDLVCQVFIHELNNINIHTYEK